MSDELPWPTAVPVDQVRAWIESVLGEPVRGPLRVLYAKFWGVTATVTTGSGEIVFKASYPPVFPDAPGAYQLLSEVVPGNVPRFLGSTDKPNQQWCLFEAVEGTPAVEIDATVGIARTIACIQAEVAGTDLRHLAQMPVTAVPDLLDDLDEQPQEVVDCLHRNRPRLRRWAAELAGSWPESIDHVDLHSANAFVRPDGGFVVYDWEEAVVSCPFFSLDRLLWDARSLGVAAQVREAYLEALPWGNLHDRRRALELALCLSPIKLAHEARSFARAHGWDHPHTLLTGFHLAVAFARWAARAPE